MAIIVPFWKSKGLSMFEIFTLQTTFALSLILLEVPSGYLSDLLGRKATLVIAMFFHGVGHTWLNFSHTFNDFLIFEVLLSFSFALFSGTDIALIYETQEEIEGQLATQTHSLGAKMFYSRMGEIFSALIGGHLAKEALDLPIRLNVAFGWLPLIIALTIIEPPRSYMNPHTHLQNFRYIFKKLFKHSRLVNLILLNLTLYASATLVGVWCFQYYWEQIDIPIAYFGVLWAIGSVVVGLTAKFSATIERTLGPKFSIIILGALPIISFLAMAYFQSFIGMAISLGLMVCRGLQPILLDALNTRVPSDMRATANSFSSLGGRVLFCLVGPILGRSLDTKGVTLPFEIMGISYIFVFIFICLPLVKIIPRREESRS